ncbi:hypothetical protein GJ744_010026 [Endocarpon pusillum]|uniref:Uncharacterized protein n=1 Tax=Endocarpon pusillum TaxID=364733 RepID=A0A8H7AIZ6_9EURO|nr:hypothetical protein GJ744_010026 [Endocarpon pusillum]
MMTSLGQEYYQFFLAQSICSALGAAALFSAGTGPIGPWFWRNRALAFGVVASGSSLSGCFDSNLASSKSPAEAPTTANTASSPGQQTVMANETAIARKNWRCEVGETFPAARSHENGIANVSAILQKAGQAHRGRRHAIHHLLRGQERQERGQLYIGFRCLA